MYCIFFIAFPVLKKLGKQNVNILIIFKAFCVQTEYVTCYTSQKKAG